MAECVDTTCSPVDRIESPGVQRSRDTTPGPLRKHYRLPDAPPSYALYDECGFYILVPKETYNLAQNPTFYLDLECWTSFNASITRSNANAFDSGFSLKISGSGDIVTAERREYAETEIFGFTTGQMYTFSMYVWFPLDWDTQDEQMFTISIADDTGDEVFSDRPTQFGRWNRVEVTKFIPDGITNIYLRLNLRSQDQLSPDRPHDPTGFFNLASEYAYFDMAQFEAGSDATTPFHGDYSTCASPGQSCNHGYRWTGVAHQSASYRPGCARDGGTLVCLRDLGFDITSHTGHGHPPLRDISWPLTNRSGEFYDKTVADSRIITLVGQLCAKSLEELECEIYELGLNLFPDIDQCGCSSKMLLVYKHEDCLGNCDVDRDLAICVTYLGGLEGNRTNHYIQNLALQFKAHDPFWFEWPGNKSQALEFVDVVSTKSVINVRSDGTVRGYPLSPNNSYTAIACMPGTDHFAIGGDFTNPSGDNQNCLEDDPCCVGLAIWNCDDWCCDPYMNVAGGTIRQMTIDNQGNVLVAGSFVTPCQYVMIIYPDDNTGCFSGYPGSEAYSVVAPFWAQVVVGTADGIHIQDFNDEWTSYVTNGIVYDFTVDGGGNLYAVGDFTEIDGQAIAYIAKFGVSTEGCLNIDQAAWSDIGHTFNGAITSVEWDPLTGRIYFGGQATTATPNPVDICETTDARQTSSNGSNQTISFTQIAGTTYQMEFLFLNVTARATAVQGFAAGDAIRITGTSSFGTEYNLLLGQHNSFVVEINNYTINDEDFYAVTWQIELGTALSEPCASLNSALVNEYQTTYDDIEEYAALDLPAGTGRDDTLTAMGAQRVSTTTTFTYDPITINYVGSFSGGDVQALGDGLPGPVTNMAVDPKTGELWATMLSGEGIYTDGLAIWNGSYWRSFPGDLGGPGDNEVIDISWCGDTCSFFLLFEGSGASLVPGRTEVDYGGSVNPSHLALTIHGPGRVEYLEHPDCNLRMIACTEVQCGEVATIDFSSGKYFSNHRPNLSPSVFGGSRLNFSLSKCKDNPLSLLITGDDARTKAVLHWRESHMGIEALCCRPRDIPPPNEPNGFNKHRDPTCGDNKSEGWEVGDIWVNEFSACPTMFVFAGCDDAVCDVCGGALTTGTCEFLLTDTNECICPPGIEECV